MHYKDEESFSRVFKEEGAAGLYFLFGGESYLIDAWAKRIISKVCGDASGFNFQKLDGSKLDIEELFNATEAMPLMAEAKCVLLEALDSSKLTAERQGGLAELFSDLNPACVLVVTAKPPSFDAKSADAKKLIKLAEKHGTAVELNPRGASGLTAFIKSVAKKHGCEIETDLCRYILQGCETDMFTLSTETAKICAYCGGGSITQRHIDAVLTLKIEARVFDLSKAMLAGNAQRAMEILANLFYLRESPVGILSVLEMAYVDLYRARLARDAGITVPHVIGMFSYKSEYRVKSAFSSRLTAAQLRKCLDYLYECDMKMKSTGLDDKILLEKAVVQLMAVGL